uniref:efflux RND transporter periplasmic adaptor subunit n=1 Tax=Ningiella ruwaisensis TaxID=2364274 RepID=UPI0014468224|nr:efflux RND transporter periplasmic adaptor subunit [Ningiella ruwaisensis]
MTIRGIVLIGCISFLLACSEQSQTSNQETQSAPDTSQAALPVTAIEITTQKIEEQSTIPGRVEAFNSAEIRPQVSGIIEGLFFSQGSFVEKGKQLYQIDPSVFEAELQSAQAQLQNAQAELKVSQARESRLKSLVATQVVSEQEYEDAQAASEKARANVALAEAAVQSAELNLDYTKMYAPISGYIGPSSVTQGALVTAQQNEALAVIQQLDPVYVDLTLSVSHIEQVKTFAAVQSKQKQASTDSSEATSSSGPSVQLFLAENDIPYSETGELIATDLTVDEATGSVKLRSIFPNSDGELIPGMYVKARIEQLNQEPSILVPQKAVSIEPDGSKTLWIVDNNNMAQKRSIQANDSFKNNWIVSEGLKEGDIVIIEGLMKLRPETKVNVSFSQEETATSKAPQNEKEDK